MGSRDGIQRARTVTGPYRTEDNIQMGQQSCCMGLEEIGALQVSIFILGAAMVTVGYLGLNGSLSVSNIVSGGGAAAIALLAYNLGRYRTNPGRA